MASETFQEALEMCVDANVLQPNANGWFNQGECVFSLFFL